MSIQGAKKSTDSKMEGIGCSICRVDAIRAAGGFDMEIKGAYEDVDLALRMSKLKWKFSSNNAIFYDQPRTTWKKFVRKNFWYGYGAHFLGHKYHMKFGYALLLPIAIAKGIMISVRVMNCTKEKAAVLLPIVLIITSIAWWMGFTSAHLDKYQPRNVYKTYETR